MRCEADNTLQEKGFSLIEMLVTMVIALVILGGLLLNFTQQNSEYKYQNKRIDAVQDMEFAIKFIAEDLRAALISAGTMPAITPGAGADPFTAALVFQVWSQDEFFSAATFRAVRQYDYDGADILSYDRENSTGVASTELLSNVTFFKIFVDGTTARGAFTASGIPAALPTRSLINSSNATISGIAGYTILIEMAVDTGYKQGSFLNVKGVDVRTTADRRKRIWRYIQIYPMSAV